MTPPFQSPDETNHFHRSAHIANGNLMGEVLDGNRLGGLIDSNLLEYSQHFDSIRKSSDPHFDDEDYRRSRQLQRSEDLFVDFANVGYYSPTVYLPHAVGFMVSNVLGLRPHYSLYVTRLCGLLSWLIIMALAIKIIPIQKVLFSCLGLLPASVSLASCISGDTFTSSLCFLWVALLLRALLTQHHISVKEYLLLCIIMGLITVNKLVYFPLVFMIFMVPDVRLSRGAVMKAGILFMTILILVTWISYSGSLFIPYSDYAPLYRDSQQLNPPVNPSAQLAWIISHPLTFTQVALVSYLESAPATLAHYIGKYGWQHHYMHPMIIGLLGLCIGVLSISRTQVSMQLNRKHRIILFGISLMMIAGLSVSLYLQWSPVGHYRIRSLSGRYLIPIIPLVLLAIPSIVSYRRRWLVLGGGVITLIGLISLVMSMYMTWYQ